MLSKNPNLPGRINNVYLAVVPKLNVYNFLWKTLLY